MEIIIKIKDFKMREKFKKISYENPQDSLYKFKRILKKNN